MRRAKEQEEEDRKMALKLQRLFQKEQRDELTKRPDGYGTRSAGSSVSPRPRGKQISTSSGGTERTFSTASSTSFSRSRSLTTIDKNSSSSVKIERNNSVSTPCPHRASQGSENCSFCILTSPKATTGAGQGAASSQKSEGKGKGGQGLKRKSSNSTATSRAKKRKDTV